MIVEHVTNQREFDLKLAMRRENPWDSNMVPGVFYHICCMNNWQEVVTEQLSVIRHSGLINVVCCILGSGEQANWCASQASKIGINLQVWLVVDNWARYELPTLQRLWNWCVTDPTGPWGTQGDGKPKPLMYLHTKGVTAPDDKNKVAWRRLMMKHVVFDWRKNVERLSMADLVGVDWQDSHVHPHFSGNFWMARTDWIKQLPSPEEFQRSKPDNYTIIGHSWKRMFAEMWVGTRPWHHIDNLVCRNENLWSGDNVFRFDVSIPGFTYQT